MNFDEAVEALVQSNTQGDAPQEGSALDAGLEAANPLLNEQAPQSTSPAAPEQPQAVERPQAPAEDSFIERADLEALLEGVEDDAARERIERAYRSFQAGFTRKTQEIAPWRKLSEQGIDPETASKAAQWYAALSDPNVAMQFYEHLGNSLAQAGLLEDVPAGGVEDDLYGAEAFEDGEFDIDPDNPLVQHVSRLEAMVQNMALQQQAAHYADQIRDAEARIREANPHYKQVDLDRIASMALNIDADPGEALVRAAADYEAWRNEIISGYLQSKGSVRVGGDVPVGAHAQTPNDPAAFIKEDGEIDFQRLNAAALARYEAEQAS